MGNPAAVSMLWRSTIQMEITGGMVLLSPVPSFHFVAMPQMQEWWEERFMCVDTTKKQVRGNVYLFIQQENYTTRHVSV